VTTAPEQPAKSTNPARKRAPAAARVEGDTATAGAVARRTFRELLDSLPLGHQFRLVVMLSVAVALLAAQLVTVMWAAWYARHDAAGFARTLPPSIAAAYDQGRGADLLGRAARHPGLVSVTLIMPSGEILRQYVRGDQSLRQARNRAAVPDMDAGLHHRIMRLLALEPIPLELPVQLRPNLSASMIAVLDHQAVWSAAGREVMQLPIALAIGMLLAFLGANSLKRHVVEPLAQLASATRVGTWGPGAQQGSALRRRNELNQLASNFDALADRLAEYERDFRNVRLESGQQIIERTRELELRLRAAEAMTRSKDEFLANMSHEIRTPMNGVLGMAELLAGTKLDKRQERFVESMRTAAQTMMQIINDILDDSKIEAGKLDLVREPFEVRELVEDVGQLFAGAAERKRLELICRVEPTVPHGVVGDVLRLRQVLGNLLSNAVKYTERGEIQLRVADETSSDEGRSLVFSVTDTGPGIPAVQHAAVFEPYTQLENATRIGGTGLGLSIATRLVRLMGGDKIDLRSEPGHGSTFSFSLPFEVAERDRADEEDPAEFKGLRVLVVDDSTSSYMGLEETLKTWSAEVAVLNRGKMLPERLRSAALRDQPFHVVLLDHGLPDGSSAELLREIRMDPAVGGTYVVLLTALDFDVTYEGTKAIEPDTCIAKPVRQESLKGALRASRAPRTGTPQATSTAGTKATDSPTPALGLTVLVVDDNAVNREVAVAMLEQSHCRVSLAHDGQAAVLAARERRFDVMLMDCQMPGMDGFAATAAIRRNEVERGMPATPIIALTANVLTRDRTRCIAAGMNGFLSKPFSAAQLNRALRPIAEARGTLRAAEPEVEATEPEAGAAMTETVPVDTTEGESEMFDPAVTDMLAAPLFEPAPQSSPSVLDVEQIKAIRSLGKPQVLERLCELLFESAPATVQSIERGLAAGDLATVAAAAHSLKSAASNLGGRRLSEQLDRCESMARDGADIAAVRTAAVGLRQSYAALEGALRELTGRRTGT
jgi:signal transduction histidine kinase/CheY-like chemotaxis protein/HPt (histidine-containing phosphotransfer) domain-containing protein